MDQNGLVSVVVRMSKGARLWLNKRAADEGMSMQAYCARELLTAYNGLPALSDDEQARLLKLAASDAGVSVMEDTQAHLSLLELQRRRLVKRQVGFGLPTYKATKAGRIILGVR